MFALVADMDIYLYIQRFETFSRGRNISRAFVTFACIHVYMYILYRLYEDIRSVYTYNQSVFVSAAAAAAAAAGTRR